MKIVKAAFIIFAVLVLLFQSGCGKKESLPEEISAILNDSSGSVTRLGIYGDPLEINPVLHLKTEHGRMVNSFVHASPLRKKADGSYEAYLFDSYHIMKGEKEGTVILDAIWKKDLKWHDGTAFDARDLEFTFATIKNPALQSPFAELAAGIESIRSLDRGQRSRVVFAKDSRQLLDLLTIGVLPSHLLENTPLQAEKAGAQSVETANYTWQNFNDKPVGLGPYKVKAREKGSYLLLEPHDAFFDAATASRSMILVRSSFDFQQLISDFRAKKYDWINLPSMLAEQLETMKLENIRMVRYPNPATLLWLFNTKRPGLENANVRKALDLIADREKVKNQMPVDGSPLFVNTLASIPSDIQDYQQRFAQALELLQESGLTDSNSDGVRELNGKPFSINILVNEENIARRLVAEDICKDLKRAGLLADVSSVSWSEFVSGKLRKGEYDTALISYLLPVGGNWVSFLHSSDSNDSLNFAGVNSPEVDNSLAVLDSMLSIVERESARATVAGYLEESRPAAFLFKPNDIGLFHAESGSSTANQPFWNDIYEWRLMFGPKDSQL